MEPNNQAPVIQTPSQPVPDTKETFMKFLLSLLFVITIVQFASFGMQSVKYILGIIFDVPVVSTPLDAMIGVLAMAASIYVFAGGVLQWIGRRNALKFLTIGALLFVIKNVFDLVNVTILYNMENVITTAQQITDLASQLGGQFFQLAFWLFVIGYFKVMAKRA